MIHILPIGIIPDYILPPLIDHLSNVFGLDIVVEKAINIPEGAYSKFRNQYSGELILESVPRRGIFTLGLIDKDLYASGLNFIFGIADPVTGKAIVALKRLQPEFWGGRPDKELFISRVKKEAVHELGHLLGLGHCNDPKCVMYFSNTIMDTDNKSDRFCRKCRAKVQERLKYL